MKQLGKEKILKDPREVEHTSKGITTKFEKKPRSHQNFQSFPQA
jgi:hypothetical protein